MKRGRDVCSTFTHVSCRGGVLVATSVLAMLGLTPASAEGTDPLDAVADVAPAVLTDASVVEPDEVTTVGEVEVVVPSDATEGVSLDVPGTADFSIGLPFADDAELVESGDHPFFDNGNGSSTVPLVKDDGTVQILTTIEDADAPSSYSYEFDVPSGASLALTSDGGAQVATDEGVVTATIDAPWAVDANGAAVPTRYLVAGDTLIQVIDFDSTTAFPVVADPSVSLGWWIYIKYSKADVARYWSGTEFLNKAAPAAACTIAAGAVGGAVCGPLTADYFSSIGSTFKTAKANKQCVEIAMTYVGGVPVKWKAYSC